jgi:DNA-directed RNA polymerase subunit RPC12/RpoP
MRIAPDTSCPGCGSRDTRRAHRTGLLASLLKEFLVDPYRCRSCRRRFFRRALRTAPQQPSLAR